MSFEWIVAQSVRNYIRIMNLYKSIFKLIVLSIVQIDEFQTLGSNICCQKSVVFVSYLVIESGIYGLWLN